MACAAAVAIGGAQLVGANGHGNGNGQDASGFAPAEGERRACTERTLRGSYVFSATGFNIVGGVPQPKAIVEVIAFNGDGTLDVPAATVSLNGVIIRSLPSVGTYTVEDNCSGTITFNGPTFDMFLSTDGDDISMIQTNPNTVFQGLATRTSRTVRDVRPGLEDKMNLTNRTLVIALAVTSALPGTASIGFAQGTQHQAIVSNVTGQRENHPRRVAHRRDAAQLSDGPASFLALQGLFTFNQGGTMSEYGIGPGSSPALRSPGHGVWQREHGWQDYSFAFTYYRYNASGVFLGSQRVKAALELGRKRR